MRPARTTRIDESDGFVRGPIAEEKSIGLLRERHTDCSTAKEEQTEDRNGRIEIDRENRSNGTGKTSSDIEILSLVVEHDARPSKQPYRDTLLSRRYHAVIDRRDRECSDTGR